MIMRCRHAGPAGAEVDELLAREGLIDRPPEMDASESFPSEVYVGDYLPLEPHVVTWGGYG